MADRLWNFIISRRKLVSLAVYSATAAVAYLMAYALRFDFDVPELYRTLALQSLPLLILIRGACTTAFRLSSGRWRFVGPRDTRRLAVSTLAGTVLFFGAAELIFQDPGIPLSVYLLDAVLMMLVTAGVWLGYRSTFEHLRWRASSSKAKRVLVIGAGEAGYALVQEMLRTPVGYRPVGFVDDNPFKWGTSMEGLEVIGAVDDLPAIAAKCRADELVIAIPTASPADMRRLVERCEAAGLPFRILPGIGQVLAGNVQLDQLREVRIEDLLGREPVTLELPELAEDLRGKSVLITGAAGSIGSELARQVALHDPATLVLLDQAETPLFYLELELRERFPHLRVVPVVGSITEAARVERVFKDFTPHRVYHAAAYKHVPLMELNPREAVRTNVIGTWRVADAAGRHGAEKFVLVSTDKAVRPVSMMGATKRLAEMVVLELRHEHQLTAYSAVRFGNVLGSNGSVIPLFRRQLALKRPLTVTHPEATRYFMTIPEAVQLILQASLLPQLRGNIAMLEMGEPVKILDLARNLLRLSGAERQRMPEECIVFTGLRAGERLHEELCAPDEATSATAIAKVRLVESRVQVGLEVISKVGEWNWAFDAGEDGNVISQIEAYFSGLSRTAAGAPAESVRVAPVTPEPLHAIPSKR